MWPSWATDRRESWGRGSPPRTQRTAPAAPTRPVSTSRHTSWPSSTRMSCSRRRNSSSVSGEEGEGGHEPGHAWRWTPVPSHWFVPGHEGKAARRGEEDRQGNKTPASPAGPNLERGAGHLLLCPLLGQSRSLHPSAGSLALSGCGLTRSGPSRARVLE